MLSLVFIYLIGRHFYRLAEDYNRNKWLFAVLGVVSYYAGSAIGGVVISLLEEIIGFTVDWNSRIQMLIIALVFGFAAVFFFQYLLKRHFEETKPEELPIIDDIGKTTKEIEDRDKGFKF